jgi:hypothetical protein
LPIVDLLPFSQNDAFKYIKNSLNDSEKAFPFEDVKILNELLGGIPLAISQAVACIKNDKNLTIEKYCQIFKKTQ